MSGRCLVRGLAWVPVLLILQGAPVSGQPMPPFASAYRSLTAGTSPASPVAADFDGDGQLDLAISDVARGNVLVFRNGVNGLPETPIVLELESPAEALAAADCDGDGRSDLAATDFDCGVVIVLLGRGDGSFSEPVAYSCLDHPRFLITADLDGDGHDDLVVTNRISNSAAWLPGSGDGTFQPWRPIATPLPAGAVAAGDMDGDGIEDLAVVGHGILEVCIGIVAGRSDGPVYDRCRHASTNPNDYGSIALGDLDEDGIADLVYGVSASSANLLIDLSTASAPISLDGLPYSRTSVGDADGDGHADLLVVGEVDDRAAVFPGSGDGHFTPAVILPTGDGVHEVAILNEFEKPVIALTNRASGTISVQPLWKDGGVLQIGYGERPNAMVVLDVDGDGRDDLVTGYDTPAGAGLHVRLGTSTGISEAFTDYPMDFRVRSLAACDADEDGRMDIVMADGFGGRVGVVLVREGGRLDPRPPLMTGSYIATVATGDVNGDGHADLLVVVVDNLIGRLMVFTGRGDGMFPQRRDYPTGERPAVLIAARIDADDIDDVAVTNYNSGNLFVFLGRRNGDLADPVVLDTWSGPVGLAAADLNGDCLTDLVVQPGGAKRFTVYSGRGDGTFLEGVDHRTPYPGYSIVCTDFDRDGITDVVYTERARGSVVALRGLPDGGFTAGTEHGVGYLPYDLMVRDVTGDGVPEAIVLRILPEGVTILAGIPSSEPPVTEFPASPELRITGVFPNPARAGASLAVESTIDGSLDVAVYDIRGRLLRSWTAAVTSAGHNCLTWDGRSDAGTRCPSGRYFISVTSLRNGLIARSTVTVAR